MESKIMQVFYDNDCLPYKDRERTVHYPVVGNGFNGFNNTQKIRFYVDRIGGTINTTWVATTKLPNGQLLYELLSNVAYDDEIGEYYVEFTISDLYTEIKGDIFIGLSGYQGGVQVEEDEDTGIYTIVGTPTIQATGTIKLTIAYAPQVLGAKTLGLTDLQQILGYLADFMKQETSIVVIANTSVDISGFEDGQMFFNLADQLLYKLVSGSLVAQKSGYIPYTGATADVDLGTRSIASLRFISEDTYRENNLLYIVHDGVSNTYTFRIKNANTNDYVATENYVDNNIYEMASASVVLSDSDYAYLLKNNVRIHYGDLFYEKAKETASQVIFYSVDYQRTTTGGSTGYTTRTTKKITLTKSSQQLDAADINDLSYNKEQNDKNFAHSFDATLNTTDYKLTLTLKNKEGNALSTKVIDLPLESIVVSATYYDSYTYDGTTYTKVIVITLATTDVPTIIPVGDLVDGLATTTQLNDGLALKVNKSDIADNLTTNDATKVLSAKQGYILKGSVDENTTAIQSKANNNEVVHTTGNETIGGNKTFTGSVNLGNFVASSINSTLRPLYDNSRDLGQDYNGQYYWKDLYLKGKWKDGTNSFTIQDYFNYKAEVNKKLAELFKAVIEEKTLSYSYLQWEEIPNNVSGYPIIYSGGSEMTNVKGNSVAFNQLLKELSTNNYLPLVQSSFTVSDGVATITKAESGISGIFQQTYIDNTHKYLTIADIKLDDEDGYNDVYLYGRSASTYCVKTADWQKVSLIFQYNTTSSTTSYPRVQINENYPGSTVQVKNFMLFDLTLIGLDSLTTVDQVRSALLERGINIDEYNAYNEGSIKNSKPTSLVVHHFNLWDEVWTTDYRVSPVSGVLEPVSVDADKRITSLNYIPIKPNTTYYIKGTITYAFVWYDKDKNYISTIYPTNTTITSPANAHYCRFSAGAVMGTTYNNDICINLSNANLNGTYKPYQAPNTYALDLPILKSVIGTQIKDIAEQDGTTVRNTYVRTLTNENIIYVANNSGYTNIAYAGFNKDNATNEGWGKISQNYFLEKYVKDSATTDWDNADKIGKVFAGADYNYYWVGFPAGTTLEQMKTALVGLTLMYEAKNPTTETSGTLPDDIAIEDGDSFEIVYDSIDNCGADFDFVVATSKVV